MKKTVIATAVSLCVMSLSSVTFADTLIMRDGTRIRGTVVSIAARTITFRHADGMSRRYPTSHVEGLEFVSADRANPRAVNGRRLEAPAGTELVVRTVETIDSRNAGADQVFSAMVEERVSDAAGQVIVPERSSAQLIVRQLSTGAPTSSPELTLDVQSITVNGRRYLVTLGTIGGAVAVEALVTAPIVAITPDEEEMPVTTAIQTAPTGTPANAAAGLTSRLTTVSTSGISDRSRDASGDRQLPQTASFLTVTVLLGLVFIGLGCGLMMFRKRRTVPIL